ncbi:MAG: hypothetical protein RBS13_06435 [Bacteroidales bacterium]|jgi:hypothetical protein|nr:hypothetical protein [Bacteroidales bacterium]
MNELIEKLETERQRFLKLFKTTKIVNNVVLTLIVLGMGATFLWLMERNLNLALIIVAILIVVLFAYSRIVKSWLGRKAYEYIFAFYRNASSHFYGDTPFTDVEILEQDGFDFDEFVSLRVLSNETSIITRNKVIGKLDRRPFAVADAGVRVQKEKLIEVAFFGKIFSFELDTPIEGHHIFHRFRDKEGAKTFAEDFHLIEQEDGFTYVSTLEKGTSSIKKATLKALDAFKLDDNLLDVTLVVKDAKAYLLLSYDEGIMNVVYEQPTKEESLNRFASDLKLISDLADTLP